MGKPNTGTKTYKMQFKPDFGAISKKQGFEVERAYLNILLKTLFNSDFTSSTPIEITAQPLGGSNKIVSVNIDCTTDVSFSCKSNGYNGTLSAKAAKAAIEYLVYMNLAWDNVDRGTDDVGMLYQKNALAIKDQFKKFNKNDLMNLYRLLD